MQNRHLHVKCEVQLDILTAKISAVLPQPFASITCDVTPVAESFETDTLQNSGKKGVTISAHKLKLCFLFILRAQHTILHFGTQTKRCRLCVGLLSGTDHGFSYIPARCLKCSLFFEVK